VYTIFFSRSTAALASSTLSTAALSRRCAGAEGSMVGDSGEAAQGAKGAKR
jgi:hypothetical protein